MCCGEYRTHHKGYQKHLRSTRHEQRRHDPFAIIKWPCTGQIITDRHPASISHPESSKAHLRKTPDSATKVKKMLDCLGCEA